MARSLRSKKIAWKVPDPACIRWKAPVKVRGLHAIAMQMVAEGQLSDGGPTRTPQQTATRWPLQSRSVIGRSPHSRDPTAVVLKLVRAHVRARHREVEGTCCAGSLDRRDDWPALGNKYESPASPAPGKDEHAGGRIR